MPVAGRCYRVTAAAARCDGAHDTVAAAGTAGRAGSRGVARGLLRPLAAFAAIAALLIAGSWQVARHGPFTVQTVQVRGADGADADAIRAAAGLAGRQVLTLDTAGAAAKVRALPWVQSAKVTTAFPRRAVIAVTERTPIAVWQVGGVAYLVDASGMVTGTADSAGDLPAVDASSEGAVQVGDRIDPDPLLVAQRVSRFAAGTLQQSIAHIAYTRADGLTITTNTGLQVRLGGNADLNYELAVWGALAQTAPTTGMHVLDLRGDRPFYR